MTFAYAGIGSRETPDPILALMTTLATHFAAGGLRLRTGGATGADQAFMRGADPELYVPWQGYNNYFGKTPSPESFEVAARYHPVFSRLSEGAQKMHARNVEIVLGPDLKSPVRFVVCWTPDGAVAETTSKTGGTGGAIRVAAAHGIKVWNLQRHEDFEYVSGLVGVTEPVLVW